MTPPGVAESVRRVRLPANTAATRATGKGRGWGRRKGQRGLRGANPSSNGHEAIMYGTGSVVSHPLR